MKKKNIRGYDGRDYGWKDDGLKDYGDGDYGNDWGWGIKKGNEEKEEKD